MSNTITPGNQSQTGQSNIQLLIDTNDIYPSEAISPARNQPTRPRARHWVGR